MKKHNGMRPQDIVILLKIISLQNENWNNTKISKTLQISASEVSEALTRCSYAKLIDSKKKTVYKSAFKEFLIYGLKYVFPVKPGAVVRGIATAHSANPIKQHFNSNNTVYVWSYAKGEHRGESIKPLYKTIPQIINTNDIFYELLVIVDTIRIGRAREVKFAIEELEKRFN